MCEERRREPNRDLPACLHGPSTRTRFLRRAIDLDFSSPRCRISPPPPYSLPTYYLPWNPSQASCQAYMTDGRGEPGPGSSHYTTCTTSAARRICSRPARTWRELLTNTGGHFLSITGSKGSKISVKYQPTTSTAHSNQPSKFANQTSPKTG